MIDAKPLTPQRVKRAYDRRSWLYSKLVAPHEWPLHLQAIEAAQVTPGERVLEVAVGPGRAAAELARLVGGDTTLAGVDLSTGMLELAQKHLRSKGIGNVELRQGDARRLPYPDAGFDLLYNAYMLDLIALADMPAVLGEFHRVLAPGGRLVLLNMSKPTDETTRRERIYAAAPASLALNLGGGCRPVLMEGPVRAAGFVDVSRTFVGGGFPSEIVVGRKPG
jgi:ubiquinone/menaquinone biosynthesis C-methylase UbiE